MAVAQTSTSLSAAPPTASAPKSLPLSLSVTSFRKTGSAPG